ncbi:hypothetical protein BH20ACT3_BH20ACT3_02650 [soil metagenome]
MSTNSWWMITLGLGLVVSIVAVVLLQLLLRQVRRIEHGADAIWTAGKQVARNTAATWLLDGTSQQLDVLAEEAARHDQFLRSAASNGGGR